MAYDITAIKCYSYIRDGIFPRNGQVSVIYNNSDIVKFDATGYNLSIYTVFCINPYTNTVWINGHHPIEGVTSSSFTAFGNNGSSGSYYRAIPFFNPNYYSPVQNDVINFTKITESDFSNNNLYQYNKPFNITYGFYAGEWSNEWAKWVSELCYINFYCYPALCCFLEDIYDEDGYLKLKFRDDYFKNTDSKLYLDAFTKNGLNFERKLNFNDTTKYFVVNNSSFPSNSEIDLNDETISASGYSSTHTGYKNAIISNSAIALVRSTYDPYENDPEMSGGNGTNIQYVEKINSLLIRPNYKDHINHNFNIYKNDQLIATIKSDKSYILYQLENKNNYFDDVYKVIEDGYMIDKKYEYYVYNNKFIYNDTLYIYYRKETVSNSLTINNNGISLLEYNSTIYPNIKNINDNNKDNIAINNLHQYYSYSINGSTLSEWSRSNANTNITFGNRGTYLLQMFNSPNSDGSNYSLINNIIPNNFINVSSLESEHIKTQNYSHTYEYDDVPIGDTVQLNGISPYIFPVEIKLNHNVDCSAFNLLSKTGTFNLVYGPSGGGTLNLDNLHIDGDYIRGTATFNYGGYNGSRGYFSFSYTYSESYTDNIKDNYTVSGATISSTVEITNSKYNTTGVNPGIKINTYPMEANSEYICAMRVNIPVGKTLYFSLGNKENPIIGTGEEQFIWRRFTTTNVVENPSIYLFADDNTDIQSYSFTVCDLYLAKVGEGNLIIETTRLLSPENITARQTSINTTNITCEYIINDNTEGFTYQYSDSSNTELSSSIYRLQSLTLHQGNNTIKARVLYDSDHTYDSEYTTYDIDMSKIETPSLPTQPSLPFNRTSVNGGNIEWNGSTYNEPYEVYVDDVLVGTTLNKYYSLSGLSQGRRTIKIIQTFEEDSSYNSEPYEFDIELRKLNTPTLTIGDLIGNVDFQDKNTSYYLLTNGEAVKITDYNRNPSAYQVKQGINGKTLTFRSSNQFGDIRYVIEQSYDDGETWPTILENNYAGTSRNILDKNMTPDVYSIRVKAKDANIPGYDSEYSNIVTFTVGDQLDTPDIEWNNILHPELTDLREQSHLVWNKVPNADYYLVRVYGDGTSPTDSEALSKITLLDSSFTDKVGFYMADPQPDNNKTYRLLSSNPEAGTYKILVDAYSFSEFNHTHGEAEVNDYKDYQVIELDRPENLVYNQSTHTLTWDAVENANVYHIYEVFEDNSPDSFIADTNTNSYTFSNLSEGSHLYIIKADKIIEQ